MHNPFTFPFAPLLLAALVPVWHFTRLRAGFPPEDILRPAFAMAVLFAVILLFFKLVVRDWHRASLLAMVPLIVFVILIESTALVVGFVVAVLVVLFMERGKVTADGTKLLNIFAVVQLFAALYVAGTSSFAGDRIDFADAFLDGVTLQERPSIIHIVLDGYSSSGVAEHVYGHDNSAFEATLEKAGFTVMDQAFTPHNRTLFAMAAVMNGTYVKPEALPDIEDWKLQLRLGKSVTAGRVPTLLKTEGYQFAYSDNAFRSLRFGDGAIRKGDPGATLNTIESNLIASALSKSSLATAAHNARVRQAFAPENYDIPARPFFYYQHVISPHPPFSLTSDGGDRKTISPAISDASHFIKNSSEKRRAYVQGYREKLKFTNAALLEQLQNLPDGPLVVIIHGDHGGGSLFNQDSLESSCAQERFATLFVVYSNMPQVEQAFSDLDGGPFNLVNTYRVLISALSKTAIDPLPDASFFNPWSALRRLRPVPPDVRAAPCTDHPLYESPDATG